MFIQKLGRILLGCGSGLKEFERDKYGGRMSQTEINVNSFLIGVLESCKNRNTETSRCLLASGTGRNISAETFLIDSNEWDDCVDVIQVGGSADDDPPAVRKLMPLEWERLIGFPDDYTLVRYRGPAEFCPDARRYKALGNSIVVPVLRWIPDRNCKHEQ